MNEKLRQDLLRKFILAGAKIKTDMGGEEEIASLCLQLAELNVPAGEAEALMKESIEYLNTHIIEDKTKH